MPSKLIKPQARILLAEDDRFLSKALSHKLTRSGFEVLLANDGLEALNKIKTEKLDLVLLDLIMPQLGGFEVLEKVRKDPRFQKIPIILMSNFGQTSDIVEGQKLGMSDYIIKSDLSLDMMIEKIVKLLTQK